MEAMESTLKSYRTFRKVIKVLLITIGLWPSFEKYPPFLRGFLSSLALVSCGLITVGAFYYCLLAKTVTAFTRGSAAMLSTLSLGIRIGSLWSNEKNLRKLNEGMSHKFDEDLKVPDNQPYLLEHFNFISRLFYLVSFGIVWMSSMMIYNSAKYALKYGKYIRAFTVALPYNYASGGLKHWGTFAVEVVQSFYLCAVPVAVDFSFLCYSMHCIGELRLSTKNFRDLKSGKDYRKNLKLVVDRHCELVNTHHFLEKIYGAPILYTSIDCAVATCMIVYQLFNLFSAMSTWRIFYVLSFGFLRIVVPFYYSWAGNKMAEASEECVDAIYDSGWTDNCDLKFRKDVLVVTSQQPLVFTCKGLMILDFKVFATVMNTAVSYYLLIKTLEEKSQMA